MQIYVLNLNDSEDRWNILEPIHHMVQRVEAIDSVTNPFVFNDYGFSLSPCGRFYTDYFSTSKGAVGCFISHYNIWKKIINTNVEYAMVLEDDVDVQDVLDLIQDNTDWHVLLENVDMIQLNKRTKPKYFTHTFLGAESYILSRNGAKKLVNAVENPSFLPKTAFDPYKVDAPCGFNISKCIYVPVDKLMGYLTNEEIEEEHRLTIMLLPRIGLNMGLKSCITTSGKPNWCMTRKERVEFSKTMDFEWCKRK